MTMLDPMGLDDEDHAEAFMGFVLCEDADWRDIPHMVSQQIHEVDPDRNREGDVGDRHAQVEMLDALQDQLVYAQSWTEARLRWLERA